MNRLILLMLICSNTTSNVSAKEKLIVVKRFEHIDFSKLENIYTISDTVNGNNVFVSLTISNRKTDNSQLQAINKFSSIVEAVDSQNIKAININFHSTRESVVKEYIRHHLSEIPQNELDKVLGNEGEMMEKEERLLSKLKLKRIYIIADKKKVYAIFDYTVGNELTQYLLVVKTDGIGEVLHLSTDS